MMDHPDQDTLRLACLLKVLSDPTRLAIFDALVQGVQCNCELGERLHLPMNLISHHLKVLRQAGLIHAARDPLDARWVQYSVDEKALAELRAWLMAFLDPTRVKPRLPDCGPRIAAGWRRWAGQAGNLAADFEAAVEACSPANRPAEVTRQEEKWPQPNLDPHATSG